jgi:hypothetical protein
MVRVILTVLVTPPPVPVTVIVDVPAFALLDTVMVAVELPEPFAMDVGLKVTVTPVGIPDADNAIADLKPPEGVADTLVVPFLPGATLTVAGAALRVKLPPVVEVTVRETVVVSVVLPAVPVTVMV